MTPTHPDLAPRIAVALERAGIAGWEVGRADPDSCWLDGRHGAFLRITPGRFDVGKIGSVSIATEHIVSLVRACMNGGTPARLAVEAGVAGISDMLRYCAGRGWWPLVEPSCPSGWRTLIQPIDQAWRVNGYGAEPEGALAQAILQALAAQPDPRGEEGA